MRQLDGTDLKRLHRAWRQRTTGRLAMVLDSVSQPLNVGSIVRTAAAWRVERLWVTGDSPAPGEGATGRTAMGTERYLSWSRAADGPDAVARARSEGFEIVGIELADEAVPLHTAELGAAVCLVIGHEDRGLSAATLAACDQVAFVPLLGRVGSLNVSAAAAVACYEVRRRHWNSADGAATAP